MDSREATPTRGGERQMEELHFSLYCLENNYLQSYFNNIVEVKYSDHFVIISLSGVFIMKNVWIRRIREGRDVHLIESFLLTTGSIFKY